MDLEAARRFLKENHRAVLATRRGDGGLQLSPVMVTLDEEGRAVVSATETRIKTRNLRRDPRAAICVMNDRFFGPWMQIEGSATIVSLPEAMEPLVDYYRSVAGEHEDWDEYRSAMRREQRVLIRIEIERAGPDPST
ncbi:MAG: PPOX class F420-dependent oxidoreductase [Actinobacteria bacterium]|nr:PPOX class F420-dependent oxidoreductase [Actinomycetota bacterium]